MTLHNTIIDLRLHIYSFAVEEKDSCNGIWLVAAKLGDLDVLKTLEGHVQSQKEKKLIQEQRNTTHPRHFVRNILNDFGEIFFHSPIISQRDSLTIETCLVENQWKELQICQHLARGGHIQGLKWARSKNCPWDTHTFAAAIMGDHWHVVQYLTKENCPWDDSACTAAATMANWHALQWLKRNECPWNHHTFAAAVQHGDMDILRWLRKEGCAFDETSCETAARFGRLVVLKWLKEESCPWDLFTAVAAAEGGHLELLLWLIEQECPYNELVVYRAAARGGHFKMLQKLKQEVFDVPSYNYRIRIG